MTDVQLFARIGPRRACTCGVMSASMDGKRREREENLSRIYPDIFLPPSRKRLTLIASCRVSAVFKIKVANCGNRIYMVFIIILIVGIVCV